MKACHWDGHCRLDFALCKMPIYWERCFTCGVRVSYCGLFNITASILPLVARSPASTSRCCRTSSGSRRWLSLVPAATAAASLVSAFELARGVKLKLQGMGAVAVQHELHCSLALPPQQFPPHLRSPPPCCGGCQPGARRWPPAVAGIGGSQWGRRMC